MPRLTRTTKLGIAAVALIFTAALLIALFDRAASPTVVLPNPNGYDDFLEAAKVFIGGPDWRTLDTNQLSTVVAQNAKALALVRSGLNKQCRVAVRYEEGSETNHLARLSEFKALAQAFVAEGKLAERQARTNDAVRSYLDCVRYGEESARGGLLIDKLVGLACEAIGMEQLRGLLPSLNTDGLQAVRKGLVELHRDLEPSESFIKQDRSWARRRFGAFHLIVGRLAAFRSVRQGVQRFREKCDRNETALRLMRTDVALRLYQLEKGFYPQKLEELVSQYLDSVPIDPFSERLLIYKPQTNSYLLYSIGPDRKDDGGLSYRRAGGGKGDFTSTEP